MAPPADPEAFGLEHEVSGCSLRPSHSYAMLTAVRYSSALLFILLALLACNPADAPDEERRAYRSVWAELYPDSLRPELAQDTLQGAFFFAAAAESQTAAEERWAKFLSGWSPANGEFEDAMQANLVTWGELEMQRLQYLKQNKKSEIEAASNKLRELAADFE